MTTSQPQPKTDAANGDQAVVTQRPRWIVIYSRWNGEYWCEHFELFHSDERADSFYREIDRRGTKRRFHPGDEEHLANCHVGLKKSLRENTIKYKSILERAKSG